MQFQEMTNKQWNMIESHLPKPARTGRPRTNDRMILNGIMFVLVTGCTGGQNCLQDMAPNQLHIADYKTCNKKESGRIFCLMQ